jgi:hypothetical protein
MVLNAETFFRHPSSYVDEGVQIGKGTKIWHFSHILIPEHASVKILTLGKTLFLVLMFKLETVARFKIM